MVTEILGFLIILGAGLALLARWQMRKQPRREYADMQASTARLKAELEHSGEAIVQRMGSHVAQLEELIRQADERAAQLDSRIADCRRLEAELELRSAELSQRAQQTVAAAQLASTAAIAPQPVMSAPLATPAPERVDAQDFATVLQNSIAREERESMSMQGPAHGQAAGLAAAVGTPLSMTPPERADEPETSDDAGEEAEIPAATRARALLMAGYSAEEAARETGLGQGAVQLIQEMNRHALDEAVAPAQR